MAADVVLSVVETDLRLLAAEAKKAEGPMTNLMGILHHSELPAVKDATERALQKIRSVEHNGLSGVQQALEILSPFALACETKYAKLACIAISAFQKLLANDAVSLRGRCEIIKALQAAERLSDESVKLRILQASLTIIQSPSFADEQDAIQQLLSLAFRLYINNKSNFAVHSTAAATIRQAVALVFDHSLLPVSRGPTGPSAPAGSPALGPSPPSSISLPTPARSSHSGGSANSPGPPHPECQGGGGNAAAAQPAGAAAAAAAAVGVACSAVAGLDLGSAPGREVVPVLLLEEMMGWLGAREGKELGWVQLQQQQQQQRGSNRIDRTFLLEMLEAVLMQRSVAIHRLPGLVQCVKAKVAPAVHGLLDSACDRLVDPNDAVDCRLVVRCAAALVRRHHDLAPERAAAMVVRLAETAGSVGRLGGAHRWQRFMALQALKPMLADPSLLYRLHHLSLPADKQSSGTAAAVAAAGKPAGAGEANGGGVMPATNDASSSAATSSGGVMPIVVHSLHDALRWYVRTSIETPEDDVVAALGNLYLQRAMGARDSVQETEAFGTNLTHGSEVVIAHLALECLLTMVAGTEALTDVVVVPAEPGMPSPKLITLDTPDVRCAAVAGLVSEQWRAVLGICNTLLARAGHEVLVGLLVRGLQGITYSAGALGVKDARDALLHSLCAHTLLPPGEDDAAALSASVVGGAGAVGASALLAEDRSVGGTSRRSIALNINASTTAATTATSSNSVSSSAPTGGSGSSHAPGFLTALLIDRSTSSVRVVLTPRNIAALRALFNLAHRLSDGLGSRGWLYVVDAVNALDRILASPHTTTAAYLLETGGEGEIVAGIQPMGSGAAGAAPSGGSGAGGGGTSVAGTAAASAAVAAAAINDVVPDDSSTTAQRELRILASAADQLFENTHHMSPEAVVSLLSALADISHRTLAGMGLLTGAGAGGGATAVAATATTAATAAAPALPSGGPGAASPGAPATTAASTSGPAGTGGGALGPGAAAVPGLVRLCALNRMVDTLLHNLWRVQDLWGIFLAHVLEVLASSNVQVRAAAVDALDRTITGALNPDLHVPDKFTAPLPALEDALSPAAATVTNKPLLPAFPSYVTTTAPSPVGGTVVVVTPSSRRSSRDLAAGSSVGVVTPGSSPPVALPPSFGRGTSSGGGNGSTSVGTGMPIVTSTAASSPPPLPPGWRVSGSGGLTVASRLVGRPSMDLSAQYPPQPALSSSPAAATSSLPFGQSLTSTTAAAAVASISTPRPAAPASNAPPGVIGTPTPTTTPVVANRGVQQSAQREDVQHMLLVALDSLYREGGRSPDVRHGLLRIALHVLQHHGDGLTRGWVPLLRLLDAVPRAGQGPADVRLGFQVVELLATDYLASSLPKEHVAKALDVIAKFATQDTVLNVSLSSITMLWNVTDHLARSRGTFSRAAAAQHQHQQGQHLKPSQPQATTTTVTVTTAAGAATVAAPPLVGTVAAGAANTAVTPPPTARPGSTTSVMPSVGTSASGTGISAAAATATGSSSPFATSIYGGDNSSPKDEKQMSPAFAAALSFARGVPSLPSAASPEPHPRTQQQQEQGQGQLLVKAGGSLTTLSGGVGGSFSYPLHDLDEAECIAMLMIAFRSLKALSVDPRPEARNAAVRTLFLAVGSHGGKFPAATWHGLFWSLLFDLLLTIYRVSATSSVEEAAAVELGKEKGGRPVVMLVHHSRNSEQKQWDETLVLALGGAAKVIRSYMPVLSGLDVWATAWEQLMQVLGELLATGRKAVCLASTSLLTTVLQTHGSGPLVSRTMWQQTLAALDRGVNTMAGPSTSAPLQARAELLTCIITLSSQLLLLRCPRPSAATATVNGGSDGHGGGGGGATIAPSAVASPDPEQLLLILKWLDRFARYPVGGDDTSTIHFATIGPIQKAVLVALTALPPAVAAAGVWPAVMAVLCNMLRPFSTLALRQFAQQVAALQQQRKASPPTTWSSSGAVEASPAASATAAVATTSAAAPSQPSPTCPAPPGTSGLDSMNSYNSTGNSSSREPSVHNPAPAAAAGSSSGTCGSSPWAMLAASSEVMEARALTPLWMARVVELLAAWYRDLVSWQVRVVTFPLLVGAMAECMACRHLLPQAQTQTQTQTQGSTYFHQPSIPQLALGGDLGEAQALDELWRAAARGFVTVVQNGLPSINICSHQGQHQQVVVPHSTWPALAHAFQMFFLASNLPPLQQAPLEVQHSLTLAAAAASSSSANSATYMRRVSASFEPTLPPPPSSEQVAADLEITTTVLDCLSETVLSSCQHAPIEMRRALMEVLDMGAASAAAPPAAGINCSDRPYDESGLPATSRLSHVCLNKLYVLCSRGQEQPTAGNEQVFTVRDFTPPTGARSQLEVAQLALPVFVTRCEAILTDYARAEHRAKAASTSAPPGTTAGTAAAAHASADYAARLVADGPAAAPSVQTLPPLRTTPAVPVALHDKTRHVLELLQQLHVVPLVSDSLMPSRPHLRFWLDVVRAVRSQANMPPPALAAAAAAAALPAAPLHTSSIFVGSGNVPGPGAVLQSPPPISRRSSSGFELPSPTGTAAIAAAAAMGDLPSNGMLAGRSVSSSFFSRTYSSTGALLSSAMIVATGGSGVVSAAPPTPPKRPSGSGGGTSLPVPPSDPRTSLTQPRPIAATFGTPGPGSVSGSAVNSGGMQLAGKSVCVKEQPHLLALYGVLCECIGSSDPAVRGAVQGMLMAVGGGVGIWAVPSQMPPSLL